LIFKIAGGPHIKGTLANFSPGGVGVTTECPLAPGDIVRILFPRRGTEGKQFGRLMIGDVAHARTEGDRWIVGIAFAWHAADKGIRGGMHQKPAQTRWFHFFSTRAKPTSVTSSRGR